MADPTKLSVLIETIYSATGVRLAEADAQKLLDTLESTNAAAVADAQKTAAEIMQANQAATKDALAGLQAIAQDERATASERIAAIQLVAEARRNAATGPGQRDLISLAERNAVLDVERSINAAALADAQKTAEAKISAERAATQDALAGLQAISQDEKATAAERIAAIQLVAEARRNAATGPGAGALIALQERNAIAAIQQQATSQFQSRMQAEVQSRRAAMEAGIAGAKRLAGTEGFGGVAESASQMSFRTGQAMERVVTGALGIQSPLQGVIDKMQYVQFMADRMGLSVFQMFSKAGAGIAGVVGASLVINKAVQFAKEADTAWEAAGLTAQGFWKNLAIGYNLMKPPVIRPELDISSLVRLRLQVQEELTKAAVIKFTKAPALEEKAAEKVAAAEADPRQQLQELGAQAAQIEGQIRSLTNVTQTPIRRQIIASLVEDHASIGAMMSRIRKQLLSKEGIGGVVTEVFLQGEKDKVTFAAMRGQPDEARARAVEEFQRNLKTNPKLTQQDFEARLAFEQGQIVERDKKIDQDKKDAEEKSRILKDQLATERKDQMAHNQAIVQNEKKSVTERVAALMELARLKKEGLTAGEQELIDVDTQKQIDALQKPKADTKGGRAGEKIDIQSDSLARIGLIVGGSSPLAHDNSSVRTANALERIEREGLKVRRDGRGDPVARMN